MSEGQSVLDAAASELGASPAAMAGAIKRSIYLRGVIVPLLVAIAGSLSVGFLARRWIVRRGVGVRDSHRSFVVVGPGSGAPGEDRGMLAVATPEVPRVEHGGEWHTLH